MVATQISSARIAERTATSVVVMAIWFVDTNHMIGDSVCGHSLRLAGSSFVWKTCATSEKEGKEKGRKKNRIWRSKMF